MIKIGLPEISIGENPMANPYPHQIEYQTKEFIEGAIFYATIADMSSGEYFRQNGAIETIEKRFYSGGGEKESWGLGWKLLDKCQEVFKITVFQNVLIAINSHWDWYIRNLGSFVIFARKFCQSPALCKREETDLNRIGFLSICNQLAILEKACDVGFGMLDVEMEALKEMSLVRNLAIHNRWEIDQKYLDNTPIKLRRNIGELRLFDSIELRQWHQSLLEAVKKTSASIATKFLNVPAYQK